MFADTIIIGSVESVWKARKKKEQIRLVVVCEEEWKERCTGPIAANWAGVGGRRVCFGVISQCFGREGGVLGTPRRVLRSAGARGPARS